MEEKDVQKIVDNALKAAKTLDNTPDNPNTQTPTPEIFKCPECGGNVKANQTHCSYCGVELEWGA